MKKAFTLIELLIVVSIIGILAVVLIPKISTGPARARDTGRIADVKDIIAAVESFYIDKGRYPSGIMCIGPIQPIVPLAQLVKDAEMSGESTMPTEPETYSEVGTDEDEFITNYLKGKLPVSQGILSSHQYCDDGDGNSYYIYIEEREGSNYTVATELETKGNATDEVLLDDPVGGKLQMYMETR